MKGSRRAPRTYTADDPAGLLVYLETASDRSVGQIQLNQLNEAANLRRHIAGEIQDWVNATAKALYASWVIQQREARKRESQAGEAEVQDLGIGVAQPLTTN